MRKIRWFALLLAAAVLVLAWTVSAGADSGACGTNVTWTVENGKLTISGTGNMEDYTGDTPWEPYQMDITSIEIASGVTGIGDYAFSGCANTTSVKIASTVKRIGTNAFAGCRMTSVTIPSGVTYIGDAAFQACFNLKSFAFPSGITAIEGGMFFTCESLESVTIPEGVTSIGNYAFAYCTSLKSIRLPKSLTSIGEGAFDNTSGLAVETPCGSTYVPQWGAGQNITCKKTHSLKATAAKAATCTAGGNSAYWTCEGCGAYYSDSAGKTGIAKDSWVIPALGHSWGSPTYAWAKDNSAVTAKRVCSRDGSHVQSEKVATTYKVTKKATYTATGVGTYTTKAFKNTAFKTQTKKVTLDKLARTPISKAKVTAIADQVYTGSAIKPALTIKYSGKKLVKGTDYTVSFRNNVKPGQATVTITGIKAYKGTVTATFKILPKPVKLLSLAPEKKKIAVMWKKGAAITGYDIEYSMNKDFSKSYTISISSALRITAKIGNLKPGKTYYVRIRTYKKVGSKVYYSTWSDSMKAKVPAE